MPHPVIDALSIGKPQISWFENQPYRLQPTVPMGRSPTTIPYKPSVVVLPPMATLPVFSVEGEDVGVVPENLLLEMVTLPTGPMTRIPVAVAVFG